VLAFDIHGLDADLTGVRFEGHEPFSELFRFEITAACKRGVTP
jgi:uncharacterized protein involved in type VI secretion and phage assembly